MQKIQSSPKNTKLLKSKEHFAQKLYFKPDMNDIANMRLKLWPVKMSIE